MRLKFPSESTQGQFSVSQYLDKNTDICLTTII